MADDDLARMLVQGACLVRLVNGQLAKSRMKRDFILMAIYMIDTDSIQRYLLYQDQDSTDHKVSALKSLYWES